MCPSDSSYIRIRLLSPLDKVNLIQKLSDWNCSMAFIHDCLLSISLFLFLSSFFSFSFFFLLSGSAKRPLDVSGDTGAATWYGSRVRCSSFDLGSLICAEQGWHQRRAVTLRQPCKQTWMQCWTPRRGALEDAPVFTQGTRGFLYRMRGINNQ